MSDWQATGKILCPECCEAIRTSTPMLMNHLIELEDGRVLIDPRAAIAVAENPDSFLKAHACSGGVQLPNDDYRVCVCAHEHR